MKSSFVLSALAASALAQSAFITVPSTGQTLSSGQSFTVTVEKPDFSQGSTDIGIGISLAQCSQDPCESHVDNLGDTLYAGAFNPQRASNNQQPTQNITVTVPEFLPSGLYVMSLEHAELIGARTSLATEINNITINIA